MYTTVNLIDEIEDPQNITCVESFDQSIYLGTVNGEIVHYFRSGPEQFIFASRQKSKKRGVKGIWLLPELQRALVLSSTTTSVFSLPEFAPCSMKSMRDVNDISYTGDGQEITVFSSSAIRMVTIQDEGLKLIRNIDYPGVLKGVRRESFALVASETYDLIDLDNVQKIPLFPVCTTQSDEQVDKLEPFIVPIGNDEFLVTSGTSKNEPAMGLVVDVNGDISRGTVAWPKYPTSVAVDFPNVAAVIDNKVMIYSLIDQSLVQTIEHTETEEGEGDEPREVEYKVMNVLQPYETRNDEVEQKLKKTCGGEEGEEIFTEYKQSSSMFMLRDDKVECLLATPRLLELEKIDKDDDLFDAMERFDLTTEQSITEMEYLKMLIGLRSLKRKTVSSIWLDGTLDPRTVVHIFSPQDVHGKLWLFHGLSEMTNGMPKSNDKFLSEFFAEWMKKRDLESVSDKHNVFKSLELAYLRLLIRTNAKKEKVHAFIDSEIVESGSEATDLLCETKKWFSLSRLYQKQGDSGKVLECWKKMLTKEWKDDEFMHGEEKMAAYLAQCKDDELVWEYGMWLCERYTPVVNVFKTDRFDDQKVIAQLKQLTNDGPRREYLKYLVYTKKSELFIKDLISFLIDDLLEKMDPKFVKQTYQEYRNLETHENKRRYVDVLSSMASKPSLTKNQVEEINLRLEVLYLLESSEYDAEQVGYRLTSDTPLIMELCIVRGKLGLHEMVLSTLCHDIRDYESAIIYCRDAPGDDSALLFKRLFLEFLRLERVPERILCAKRLLNNYTHALDTSLVLEYAPKEWPVEVFDEYFKHVFRALLNEKNKSMVSKNLTRAEHRFITDQLAGFERLADQQ